MLSDEIITAPADVLVLPMTDDLGPAVRAAKALRLAGVRAQLYTEQKKFKQKMSYADKLAIPFCVLLGEDEVAAGKWSVKDMRSGEQQLLPPDEATAAITAGIAAQNAGSIIKEA